MADSFDQIFATEYQSLRRYLYRRVGGRVADDLAAETFAIAYRRWDDRDSARAARPWLYGIATNLARHHWRKEGRMLRAYARSGNDPIYGDDESSTIDRADAQARQRAVATALAALGRADREVLLLHAWADLSDQEIAQAVSIPLGTAKSRLNRARLRMRKQLDGSGQVGATPFTTAEE